MVREQYDSPRVTEYGSVEAITKDVNKCGFGEDQYSEQDNDLVGSVQDPTCS
jgi:hypothetical protein